MVEASLVNYVELAVLLGGVIIALQQIRDIKQTRQAQLFMQLYDHHQSAEYKTQANKIYWEWEWSDFDDFIDKYGPWKHPETYAIHASVASFYAGIGVLVKRGLIDVTLVDDLMVGSILRLWDKMGPFYLEARKRWNWPQMGEWFEYLYNQVKQISDQQLAAASR